MTKDREIHGKYSSQLMRRSEVAHAADVSRDRTATPAEPHNMPAEEGVMVTSRFAAVLLAVSLSWVAGCAGFAIKQQDRESLERAEEKVAFALKTLAERQTGSAEADVVRSAKVLLAMDERDLHARVARTEPLTDEQEDDLVRQLAKYEGRFGGLIDAAATAEEYTFTSGDAALLQTLKAEVGEHLGEVKNHVLQSIEKRKQDRQATTALAVSVALVGVQALLESQENEDATHVVTAWLKVAHAALAKAKSGSTSLVAALSPKELEAALKASLGHKWKESYGRIIQPTLAALAAFLPSTGDADPATLDTIQAAIASLIKE